MASIFSGTCLLATKTEAGLRKVTSHGETFWRFKLSIRLIEIGIDGKPVEYVELPEIADSVCQATFGLYAKSGFDRPWIGYLAIEAGRVVGTCAFKSPPRDGCVEIAYFSFPGEEGRGVATRMARELLRLAREFDPGITPTAFTLPEENASTSILRKLGFERNGMGQDDEAGEVWAWKLG